ncbi:MAG: DegT/DnrJ/EryC1/StrS aminotransferase family protein [Actinobacteria bacterium]|nr:MAG: DegT/DnrJ/EryC1/StrS aminotransferase family protein [Actinomycetota bacterium]
MIPLNDLGRPWPALNDAVRANLTRVNDSGLYLGGPFTDRFEEDFARYLGLAGCIGVNSGTDALYLALAALGIGPGSTVVTTANAGYYSTLAVRNLGARAVYCDVNEDTGCMSARSLRDVLSRTSVDAVVVTHMYGQLAPMEALLERCRDIPIIEDCAHAVGSHDGGRQAGAFGAIAAFSFYPTKNLAARGDAGAVASDDPALLDTVRHLAQYGWTSRFEVSLERGINSRLDEFQAAVLVASLPYLDEMNARRRDIMREYRASLPGQIHLFYEDSPAHTAHLAVLRTSHGDREPARRRLAEAGIATGVHYPIADHRQPVFDGDVLIPLPVTDALTESILTVPCFATMTDDQVQSVSTALATCFPA